MDCGCVATCKRSAILGLGMSEMTVREQKNTTKRISTCNNTHLGCDTIDVGEGMVTNKMMLCHGRRWDNTGNFMSQRSAIWGVGIS